MLIEQLYKIEQESFMELFKDSDLNNLDWMISGNLFLVTHYFHDALIVAEMKELHPIKEKIMLNLAHSYEANDNPAEAIRWYKKCQIEPFFSTPLYQTDIIASIVINLLQCGELPQTEEYLNKLPEVEKIGDSSFADTLIAVHYYLQVKKLFSLECFYIEEIKILLRNLEEHYQRLSDQTLKILLDVELEEMLGDLSNLNHDFSDSAEHYLTAMIWSRTYHNRKKESVINLKLSMLHEQEENYRLAFERYNKYYQLSEELCKEKSDQYSSYLLEVYHINNAENDICQLRKLSEKLTTSRNTDSLTGVHNRRFWDETLRNRTKNTDYIVSEVSILMLDVDNSKKYNDRYGHIQGDEILKEIGGILQAIVQHDNDIVARYGGEEFVILLEATGIQGSKEIASDILQHIRELSDKYHGKGSNSISLSIGIFTGSLQSESNIGDMIRSADKALYFSKKAGKNTFTHIADIPRIREANHD